MKRKNLLVSMYEASFVVEIITRKRPLSLEIVVNGISYDVDTSNMDYMDVIGHVNRAVDQAGSTKKSREIVTLEGNEAKLALNYFQQNGLLGR